MNGSSADGTDIQLWNRDAGRPQTWRFVETDFEATVNAGVSDMTVYKIVNVKSGTVLDLSASRGDISTCNVDLDVSMFASRWYIVVRAYHEHHGRNQMVRWRLMILVSHHSSLLIFNSGNLRRSDPLTGGL